MKKSELLLWLKQDLRNSFVYYMWMITYEEHLRPRSASQIYRPWKWKVFWSLLIVNVLSSSSSIPIWALCWKEKRKIENSCINVTAIIVKWLWIASIMLHYYTVHQVGHNFLKTPKLIPSVSEKRTKNDWNKMIPCLTLNRKQPRLAPLIILSFDWNNKL